MATNGIENYHLLLLRVLWYIRKRSDHDGETRASSVQCSELQGELCFSVLTIFSKYDNDFSKQLDFSLDV